MSSQLERLRAAISDRYEIERELGRGAMATVYLARDVKHDRHVALKVLLADIGFALGPERFRREIELASHLSHPHILPIYDSGEANGELYYVMPYVAGESLRARLNREHQLPLDEALRITCEVASALDHSHRAGIIHRDIKPENILLEDGQALVADFGIARAMSAMGDQKLTSTGVSLGTPTYMSPEQGMADPNLDRRSDIYSLGCVLYEMLAGQPPFTGRTSQALIARHSLDQVPSLSVVRNTIPEEVEDAVLRALAKVPADRFATAAEFASALRACQGTGSQVLSRSVRRTRQTQAKNRNRNRVIALAAGGIVLLAAGIWAGKTYLMDGGGRRSLRAADAGGLRPERIAVLYFADLTPDKRLAYLADGLTESLIRTLSGVTGLDVISTGGVKQFRGTEASPDSVGRSLQAGTLVEGTVEPVGERVRVNVRLLDGASGAVIERTAVTEPLGDPLVLNAKLTENIANMLRESLGDEVRLRELRAGTKNPVAWSLVQRAEKMRKDAEALEQARNTAGASKLLLSADTLLAQAEQRDPGWGEPIVLRGVLAGRQEQLTRERTEMSKWIDIGLGHANRAIALDPRDASALELRGMLRVRRIGRELITDQRARDDSIEAAEADLRAAIRANPSQAIALNTLSGIQYAKQDVVEAHNLARAAYAADAYLTSAPAILWRLYVTAYDLGQFPNAERWCNEEARRFPQHLFAARCQLWIMTTQAVRPEPAEAWKRARDLERVAPAQQAEYYRREAQIVVAAVLARAAREVEGNRAGSLSGPLADSARRVLVRARAGPDVDPRGELLGYEAFARALLGDSNEAIGLLQKYLTDHPEHRKGFAKVNAWWWRSLQNEPRFQDLVALAG